MKAPLLRRLLVGAIAMTIAVHPLAAQDRFYFRNVQGGGSSQNPGGQTPNNPEPGEPSVSVGGSFTFLTNEAISILPSATNLAGALWTISPGLRSGLSLDASTGRVYGNTSVGGQSSHTLTATSGQRSASASFSLNVNLPAANPPVISSYPSSFVFVAGEPLSITAPAVSGGVTPYSYTISLDQRPFDFSASTGAISWATPQPGTWGNLVVGVTGANEAGTSSNPFSITVNPALTAGVYPAGMEFVVGQQVSIPSPGASGGKAPLVFTGGTPNGLGVASTGEIQGSPSAPGPISISARVRDVDNRSVALSFEATAQPALDASQASLPGTIPLNVQIANVSFVPMGGKAPLNYEVIGDLPPGLTFANGILSGTPTSPGPFNFFVTVEDSMSPPQTALHPVMTEVVAPSLAVQFTTPPQANAQRGVQIAPATFSRTGGTGNVTYILVGTPPSGLYISGNQVVGAPDAPGTFNFAVRTTDSGSPAQQVTSTYYGMAVAETDPVTASASASSVSWTSGEDVPEPLVFSASGGHGPYTYQIVSGGLPNGLNLTGNQIAGQPSITGSFPITVRASDSSSPAKSNDVQVTIAVYGKLGNQVTALPEAVNGSVYTFELTSSGGHAPITWSMTGTLPTGLQFDAPNRRIYGTPTVTGTFAGIVVTATDVDGRTKSSPSMTLTVSAPAVNIPRPATISFDNGQTMQPSSSGATAIGYLYDTTSGTLTNTNGASGTPLRLVTYTWTTPGPINCVVVAPKAGLGPYPLRFVFKNAAGTTLQTQDMTTASGYVETHIYNALTDVKTIEMWSVSRLNMDISTFKGGNWNGSACATAS